MGATLAGGITEWIELRLKSFLTGGYGQAIDLASSSLTGRLKANIRRGVGADGGAYSPVKETTMKQSIKRSGDFVDPRIRGEVQADPRAFGVTGRTESAIYWERRGNSWEIGYDDDRTGAVLMSNAFPESKSNVPKEKRDPIGHSLQNPTEAELDIVEAALLYEIEALLT